MKTAIYKMMVLVVLLAIPATILYAQPTGTWFKVPFPFTIGDKAMPAGEYFVEALYWNAVAFHRSGGKAVLVTIAQSREPRNVTTPKLVFRHFGNVYFLAEVQFNADSARAFAPGKQEIELTKVQKRPAHLEVEGR
jgi:hypothetical protein